MPLICHAGAEATPKLFDYVRKGILDLLDIGPQVRERLARMSTVDVTPFHRSLHGVLAGDVADPLKLGPDGEPYPRMDWETTFDHVENLPDGRTHTSPHFNFTAQIAPRVQFIPLGWRIGIGLNNPSEFAVPDAEDGTNAGEG